MRRLVLLVLVLLAAAPATAAAKRLTVVQANVGTINPACAAARYKLCQPAVEARAAEALQAIRPDVAGFEEIRPEPGNAQVHRLLGPGYAVACDTRFGWDCVAVRKASGVKLATRLRTRPVAAGCQDTGFTLDRATLAIGSKRVAFGVAHPDSTVAPCRAGQLRDFFRTFAARGRVLALGDFNMDPYRERDASTSVFSKERKRLGLRLASGWAVSLEPGSSMGDPTGTVLDDATTTFPPPFGGRALDHVLTRGLKGSCGVRRIDGGGGMDHRAQVCRLRP
jgi:endonuclease/exonuclease/phosphatase family metal-dependent hydrolase